MNFKQAAYILDRFGQLADDFSAKVHRNRVKRACALSAVERDKCYQELSEIVDYFLASYGSLKTNLQEELTWEWKLTNLLNNWFN